MSDDITDSCTDIQPQLAAYALGEADADANLLDHLAACPSCQRDLRAYLQVARVLAYDVSDVAPPPELRERILAAVDQQEQQPAAPPPRLQPALPPAQARRRRIAVPWPAMAFAIAAILALLGWNISLRAQLGEQNSQIAASREGWQTMIALLNDSAVRWYSVAGGSAQGHIWTNASGRTLCLVAQGMPALTGGQVYQVWLLHGNNGTSAGVFEGRNGNGWVLMQLDEPLANYDSINVSIEPPGGSPSQTGPPILHGALSEAQTPNTTERQHTLQLLTLAADQLR